MQQPSYFESPEDNMATNPTLSLESAARNSADLEGTAEQVIHAKQLLIDLDRRKNQIREGIRALKNKSKEEEAAEVAGAEELAKLGRSVRAAKGGPREDELRKDMLAAGCKPTATLGKYRDSLIADFIGMPTGPAQVQDLDDTTSKKKNMSHNNRSNKMWLLCSGGAFLKTDPTRAINKLLKDQFDTDAMIEETREELRRLTTELARIEGPDSALARLHAGMELRDQPKARNE